MTNAQGNRGWAAVMVAANLMMLAMAIAAPAQNVIHLRTLWSFNSPGGNEPVGALVQAADGNLYGATLIGGLNDSGTVFKVTPEGSLRTLYSFCSQSGCADGAYPQGALVQALDGNFYGTTYGGGISSCDAPEGCGTVFKITPSGVLTMLHSFDFTDGATPFSGLIQNAAGNFYGTTYSGGANGLGTVFEMTPEGAVTTLHSFLGPDGYSPHAALLEGGNGNFYGTTLSGGADGAGTVFEITEAGFLTTLYNFCSQIGCADGEGPVGNLIQDSDGDFYGTTFGGGTKAEGTVFKLTPAGKLTTIYSCDPGPCGDGQNFNAGLVQGTDGNFYGLATYGGAGDGTIFRIEPRSGLFTLLYSFCSVRDCLDGGLPVAPLVQDTNGDFYGTTFEGGAATLGTIFVFSVGLGPFVETQPVIGRVGATTRILGKDLRGATSVSFNGTPATFTVSKSGTYISTTVPADATTGPVQVMTPSGTLTSNVNFQVLP
jgi:uncharacterized repeat protein (TIGR03803 family)